MGEIAENFADGIIVTDDNPRNEDSDKIRKSILETCPSAVEIPNRKEAIIKAINQGEKGDSILIAGKGHENFQITKNKTIEFSDQDISSEALKKKLDNIQND